MDDTCAGGGEEVRVWRAGVECCLGGQEGKEGALGTDGE